MDLPKILEQLKNEQFESIAGTNLRLRIPLTEKLMNEVARPRVEASDSVEHFHIHIQSGNVLVLELRVVALLGIKLKRSIRSHIQPNIDFQNKPVLQLVVENKLEKKLLNLFQEKIEELLPTGIDLADDTLKLKLDQLMKEQGFGYLIPLVQNIQVESVHGTLYLNVEVCR